MEIQSFLKQYTGLLQSPSSVEKLHPKIVSNYNLAFEDAANEIIDWVLHYLETKQCPYELAVAIAKKTVEEMNSCITASSEQTLNSVVLYNDAIRKLSSICGSLCEEGVILPSSYPYTASVFAIKNKRRTMEDRHVIHHDLNRLLDLKDMPEQSYYAVFDGHSGVDAASYASAHLHVNLAKHPSFLTDPCVAIKDAYKTTDENFIKLCAKENLKSGSTAVSALIREKTIYLSWLGDSQAVLVKGGKPTFVSQPHKPDREDEQKRIEELGGYVSQMGVWRVNGILAVTRAIGNPDYKHFISSEADVVSIPLEGNEDFLILACDGLFDGMSPEEVTSALYHNLSQSGLEEPLETVAAKLVHQSKLQGSEDNITAVVVFLRDIKDIKEYAAKIVPHKPTVLELDADTISAKKLKNAANVLSSAGLADPAFSYKEADCMQSVCPAPEATVLSELPTPPIDDVVASQQFESLKSEDLYHGLNSIVLNQHCSVDAVELSNTIPMSEINAHVEELTLSEGERESCEGNITPDEAADIASTVVSNTIENAMNCISSSERPEDSMLLSPTKLNPYAAPFVMPSFVSDDNSSQNEIDISKTVHFSAIPEQSVESKDNRELATPSSEDSLQQMNPVEAHLLVEDTNVDLLSSNELSQIGHDSCIDLFENSSETQENKPESFCDSSMNSENLPSESLVDLDPLKTAFSESHSEKPSEITRDESKDSCIEMDIECADLKIVECQTIECQPEVNKIIEIRDLNEGKSDTEPVANLLRKSTSPHSEMENVTFDSTASIVENTELEKGILEASCMSNKPDNEIESNTDLLLDMSEPAAICDEIQVVSECPFVQKTDHFNSNAELRNPNQDLLQLDNQVQLNSLAIEQKVERCLFSDNCSENFAAELPLSTIPTKIVLESGITLINTEVEGTTPGAILSSDHTEECPAETFAVDLEKVPDGIPEADGVTEDIDSDSEKDGGWSYMKVNAANAEKCKRAEGIRSKSEKPASKQVNAATNKKSAFDVRNRIKTAKSSLADKKNPDPKEKLKTIKSTVPSISKVTTEKSNKTAMTLPLVKKEATVKTNTSKTTRSIVPRSRIAPNKPAVDSNRAVKPGISNIAGSKSVASDGTNTIMRCPTASRPTSSHLSKGVPSTISAAQPTRSVNVGRATQPVPSKVPTKPSTSKTATLEAKPKQPFVTMRRPVASTLKKTDVKETKDIVNKQISSGKIGASGRNGTVKSALSKPSTLGNQPKKEAIAKPRPLPVRNDPGKVARPKTLATTTSKTTTLKSSKDSSATSRTTKPSVQSKIIHKPAEKTAVKENNIEKITPASEDEKFIREANDKEVLAKEQFAEASPEDQHYPPKENGIKGSSIDPEPAAIALEPIADCPALDNNL